MSPFVDAREQIRPLAEAAMAAADARQLELTKPPGSLGRLEDLARRLAGITDACPPPVPEAPIVAVFAADHGVVASGVTPWPQEVTAQMVANFVGGGAGINAIADQIGVAFRVVDVGVATPLDGLEGVDDRRIRAGTGDLSLGPAMTRDDVGNALDAGAGVATELVAARHDLLITGEMGIGNTTATACLVGALTGRPADAVTGRGTGIDDVHLARKLEIVERAIGRTVGMHPLDILAEVGGLEIAAITGFIVGGAAAGVPVVVDGAICCAAALVAERVAPGVAERCFFAHRSVEPAASIVLDELGADPVLDLGLRLGEGTGGALAVPVIQAAAAALARMATFGEAGVG